MKKHTLMTLFIGVLCALNVMARAGQPKPLPNTYVHDFAGVISASKKDEINAKAKQLKDYYKTEIALVTIKSLNGEDQFDYSMRMARSWGIGSPDNDVRGLLILVAVKDRKTSFRTSRHIEGELPDMVTGDISRTMNEFFKRGDFGGGLLAGMDRILARVQPAYTPPQNTAAEESSGFDWLWLLIVGLPVGTVAAVWAAIVRRKRWREEEELDAQTYTQTSYTRPMRRFYSEPSEPTAEASEFSTAEPERSDDDYGSSYTPSYSEPSSSDDSSPSTSSWFDSSSSSSSWSDSSSSSSSSDSDSSYSGGSDFGGGGSDSSW